MITLTLIGIGFAGWFGRTAGRLGHGFWRATLWSVVGFTLFLGLWLGVPWSYEMLRTYASAPDPDGGVGFILRAARFWLAIGLPLLVRSQILLKTGVPTVSVLPDHPNKAG